MSRHENTGIPQFYKSDPSSDRACPLRANFSVPDCPHRHKPSLRPFSRKKLSRLFFILCFQVVLVFTGCCAVPDNAPLTIPDEYDLLAEGCVDKASFPHQETAYLTYEEIESLARAPHPEGPCRPNSLASGKPPSSRMPRGIGGSVPDGQAMTISGITCALVPGILRIPFTSISSEKCLPRKRPTGNIWMGHLQRGKRKSTSVSENAWPTRIYLFCRRLISGCPAQIISMAPDIWRRNSL